MSASSGTLDRIGPFEYKRFSAALPLLDGNRERHEHDVVIAGGGPVGLATALGLSRFGVRSVVIEADGCGANGDLRIG